MKNHGFPRPEIRIQLSALLYHNESQILDKNHNGGQSNIASLEKYQERAKQYKAAWKDYETTILDGMTDALGVTFYQNVIDVALAPYFRNKSFPLIMNLRPDPDVFVDKLTHELLHIYRTITVIIRRQMRRKPCTS